MFLDWNWSFSVQLIRNRSAKIFNNSAKICNNSAKFVTAEEPIKFQIGKRECKFFQQNEQTWSVKFDNIN